MEAGERYGRLVALNFSRMSNDRRSVWLFRCDCGREKEIQIRHVESGKIASCRCLQVEVSREAATTHGYSSRQSGDPLVAVWHAMKSRCYNPKNAAYRYYGERGIGICSEWLNDVGSFITWSRANGYTSGLTIDRIDNDLGYAPDNCRWVTWKVQNGNRRKKCG